MIIEKKIKSRWFYLQIDKFFLEINCSEDIEKFLNKFTEENNL